MYYFRSDRVRKGKDELRVITHAESKRGKPVEGVIIRALKKEDLEAIVKIDEKVLGQSRKDYWERKLEALGSKSAQTSFAAEVQGKVVGFILGDISGWEFGVPDTIGWIEHDRR